MLAHKDLRRFLQKSSLHFDSDIRLPKSAGQHKTETTEQDSLCRLRFGNAPQTAGWPRLLCNLGIKDAFWSGRHHQK
jgi:hypothetical protein